MGHAGVGALSCWSGHYTEAFCCDTFGDAFPEGFGNPECWDSLHTYERCCKGASTPKPVSSSVAGATSAEAGGSSSSSTWPPGSLLALLGSAGPLARHAGLELDGRGNIDMMSFRDLTRWFPAHLPLSNPPVLALDHYSKGSTCNLELTTNRPNGSSVPAMSNRKWEVDDHPTEHASTAGVLASDRWFAAGSNCRPHLHCPLWAPLAVPVIDRAASMSVLLWLAVLDGRPRRRAGMRVGFGSHKLFEPAHSEHPSLWELWESLAEAYNWGDWDRMVRHWLVPEYTSVGLQKKHLRNVSSRLMLSSHHIGMRGRRMHLPPNLCFTCCMHGNARMRVVFVRSPFSRLVSYFRMSWLGKLHKLHNRWEDFPAFVRYVSDSFDAGGRGNANPLQRLQWSLPGSGADEFTDEDVLHTRAISDWLQDPMIGEQPLDLAAFRVVHVEHLSHEVPELVEALCKEHGFCKALPSFPRINSFTSGVPSDVWAACWSDTGTVERVRRRYAKDFEWFEYSSDPLSEPPVRAGLGRLRFTG